MRRAHAGGHVFTKHRARYRLNAGDVNAIRAEIERDSGGGVRGSGVDGPTALGIASGFAQIVYSYLRDIGSTTKDDSRAARPALVARRKDGDDDAGWSIGWLHLAGSSIETHVAVHRVIDMIVYLHSDSQTGNMTLRIVNVDQASAYDVSVRMDDFAGHERFAAKPVLPALHESTLFFEGSLPSEGEIAGLVAVVSLGVGTTLEFPLRNFALPKTGIQRKNEPIPRDRLLLDHELLVVYRGNRDN